MAEHVSKYVRVSDRRYALSDGTTVRMLYASRTGSMVCVPERVGDQVANGDVIEIDVDTLAGLREIEAVVMDSIEERNVVLARQKEASSQRHSLRYVLLPTTYCNMGCSYCGQEHTRGNLSANHRAAVAARVLAGIAAPTTTDVKVTWFGGEPMIGYPMVCDLSRQFIEAAQTRGIGYEATMVTNGTLLTIEKLRYLHLECKVSRFDITLDGPARIHDIHRPLKSGKSSFDRITGLIQQVLASEDLHKVFFVARTNVDVNNVAWVDEYIDTVAGLGFASPQISMNLAPVYPWGNDVSNIEIERSEYARAEVAWMRKMLHLGMRFEALPQDATGAVCTAVTGASEIHSSTGNLFSCSEFPLVPQHEATGGLGKLTLLPVLERRPDGPFDDWHDSVAAGQTPCHSCFFLPVCGGACPKQWREGQRPCPPYKFTLQERFDLVAEMNGLRPL